MITKHDQHTKTTIGQKPVASVLSHASTAVRRRYKITTAFFGHNLSNEHEVCETII